MAKYFIAALFCVSTALYAQDTVWIESPRVASLRRESEETISRYSTSSDSFRTALHRIEQTPVTAKINCVCQITPLEDIVFGETEGIVLTAEMKNSYIAMLEKKVDSMESEYNDARESIKICNYLETKRKFYIRDHPITYYFDRLSSSQFDSLFQMYLEHNSPNGGGMYYFDDWLWLKLHHRLPEDNAPVKKEDTAEREFG